MEQPEILIRTTIPEKYLINAIQISLKELIDYLEDHMAVLYNFYTQKYGVEVKEFKYTPTAGYFVDMTKRAATHKFECGGVTRRDNLFEDKKYQPIVPEKYRTTFFDLKDAKRCYAIPITKIIPIEPIPIENFRLWESNSNIAETDDLVHPRPIYPM